MNKRYRGLSIGQSIFVMTVMIVGTIMFISAFITYQILYNQTTELVINSSQEINKQIILNYENYLSDVIEISNNLQKDIVENSQNDDWTTISLMFNYITEIDKNVRSVSLYDVSGHMISSSEALSPMIMTEETWFVQAYLNQDIHYFSNPYLELFNDHSKQVITISKYVSYIDQGVSKYGILAIDVNTDDLVTLAEMSNLGQDGHILIINNDNRLVYSSSTFDNSQSLSIANDLILGGQFVELNHQSFYVNVNTIKYTRWKIATFINADELENIKSDILTSMIFVFAGTLVIIVISSAFFSMRITRPMHKLENHIKKIESGDFESHIQVDGQKEVILLADAFNQMSDEIGELMQKVLTEQDEKRKTQFIALQNQINPHFLYNTLDSIVYLSENHKNKEVEQMIIALSKFFRMSITDEMNLVSLENEIEHVKSYLTIQQIRYSHGFSYDFSIEDQMLKFNVLKLSLQPLVENALIHGIQPDEEFNHIHIKAYEKEGNLYLEVINEGYGLNQERIDDIHKMIRGEITSTSMGLKNVYQRLKLYYGEEADLYITSTLDESTTVTMKMPLGEGKL